MLSKSAGKRNKRPYCRLLPGAVSGNTETGVSKEQVEGDAPVPDNQPALPSDTKWKSSLFGSHKQTALVASNLIPGLVAEKIAQSARQAGFSVVGENESELKVKSGNVVITCKLTPTVDGGTQIKLKTDVDYHSNWPLSVVALGAWGYLFIRCSNSPGGRLPLGSMTPVDIVLAIVFVVACLYGMKKQYSCKGDIDRFKNMLETSLRQ